MIELREVSRHFRLGKERVEALHRVSIRIAPGEFVLIKGPSGSGKTTLLNLISGLDRPSEGALLIGGIDLAGLGDVEISNIRNQKIGYVFQSFYLEGNQSAIDNVALPLVFGGVPLAERRTRGRAMLERVGLGHKAHERAANLSAGQKQRVALARAIVNRPGVILADEPTANLDYRTGDEILELLRRVNAEDRTTVLLVSHQRDLQIAGARNFWIEDGRLVEGTPTPVTRP